MNAVNILRFIVMLLVCAWAGNTSAASLPNRETGYPSKALSGKSEWPDHLRFLSGPKGGQWFTLGELIKETLTKNVAPTTSRVGGGMTNIENISGKKADIAFTLACFMGAARSGEEEYAGIKADNAALLANIYPQVLYFLLRKDFADKHGIATVEDLLKKEIPLRFASLKPGTGSEFILNILFKYAYNTSFEKLRAQGWSISFNNYAETADSFVAGDLDCFAYTAGTKVPLILTLEEHTAVTILSLDQKSLDLLAQKFKTGVYIIQPGIYKSVTQPIRTLGDYSSLVVRKDLPNDLVFAICKTLWENRDRIGGAIVDFMALSPKTALPEYLPTHPGAELFWNSLGAKGDAGQ